jgi:hypothetical protein
MIHRVEGLINDLWMRLLCVGGFQTRNRSIAFSLGGTALLRNGLLSVDSAPAHEIVSAWSSTSAAAETWSSTSAAAEISLDMHVGGDRVVVGQIRVLRGLVPPHRQQLGRKLRDKTKVQKEQHY